MSGAVPSYRKFVERLLLDTSQPNTPSPGSALSTPDHLDKTHIYSRTPGGCKTCKKRRVKCDQTNLPSCLNCTKRGIQCDWPPLCAGSAQQADPDDDGPTSQPIFTQGLSHSDLELLHHFTTTTAVSLLDVYGIESPPVLDIYQRHGPRLALAHPFLMHSLLALSALHLHWLIRRGQPLTTSSYYVLSCYHRKHAVQTYNSLQCDRVSCSPQCTCCGRSDAQFLANLILSLHAFCDMTADVLELMYPVDRMRTIVRTTHLYTNGRKVLDTFYRTSDGHLLVGPTSPASSQGQGPSVYFPNISPTFHSSLTCVPLSPLLYTLHIPHSGAPDDNELLHPDPPNTAQIYADLVHALHIGYRLFFERHAPLRAVKMWIASTLPTEITELLAQRRPRAIVAFAHTMVLHRWCRLREAEWWKADPELAFSRMRDMLPNDSWREYLDSSLP
ncbi:hypothetical protein DL96DRAFT_1812574 [Flagelloscypha sp. PMI_526]|nr:hypothetical protein DL96DRAFT_1812574 [Flagelloscypha sp. PMI_526]